MARKDQFFKVEALPYWALVAFLVLTFLVGGASRADVQSLIILRPAAIIFCGIGLWHLKWEQVKAYRFAFGMTAAMFLLVLAHLVPLPPSLWSALPGREIITEIDQEAALGGVWRPVAMVPSAAWNAFYALFVPLAVLILGVQLTREQRFRLLPLILGLGLFSGLMGLLQTLGDPQGPLYLYNITNNGAVVGLFSNRNHQAIFLASLFPMLAAFAHVGIQSEEQARVRGYMSVAAGIVLVPLILVTGSRAGLILAVAGMISISALYRKPIISVPKKRRGTKLDLRWMVGAFAVLCLGALSLLLSRAEALQRITAPDQVEDMRFQAWPPILEMTWRYFPFGSGMGSFVEVYQLGEPYALLVPTYLNHAHNDWLETILTGGLPAMALLIIAMLAWARMAIASLSEPLSAGRDAVFARLGAAIVLILALGSIGDYPLRTPSLACVFVVAVLWLSGNGRSLPKNVGSLDRAKLGEEGSG